LDLEWDLKAVERLMRLEGSPNLNCSLHLKSTGKTVKALVMRILGLYNAPTTLKLLH